MPRRVRSRILNSKLRNRFSVSKSKKSLANNILSISRSVLGSSNSVSIRSSTTSTIPILESSSSDDESILDCDILSPDQYDNKNNESETTISGDTNKLQNPFHMSLKLKTMCKNLLKLNVGEAMPLKFHKFANPFHKKKDSPTSPNYSEISSQRDSDSSYLLAGYEESWYVHLTLVAGKRLYSGSEKDKTEPIVKFYYDGSYSGQLTNTIADSNPMWNEVFVFKIGSENDKKSISFEISDNISKKSIGTAVLELKEVSKTEFKQYNLSVTGSNDVPNKMIVVKAKILHSSLFKQELMSSISACSENQAPSFLSKRTKDTMISKRKMSSILAYVSIILISGKNFFPSNETSTSDIFVKFKIGKFKAVSKVIKKTLTPEWFQQFKLSLTESVEPVVQVIAYQYDSAYKSFLAGRTSIDLRNYTQETSHKLTLELDDNAGLLEILLTVSGVDGNEINDDAFSDLVSFERMRNQYGLFNSFNDLEDVGRLYVKVVQAKNIKYDGHMVKGIYCTVQLLNSRVQTQKDLKKTENPLWNKTFAFNVSDIHWPVEIDIKHDLDGGKKSLILGKIFVPLLKINNGELRWYTLKDIKLENRTAGTIQLQMYFMFNHLRAVLKTVVPKDMQYCQILDRKLTLADILTMVKSLKTNLARVTFIVEKILNIALLIDGSFEWNNPGISCAYFICMVTITMCFELYMLPLLLIVILATTYVSNACTEIQKRNQSDSNSDYQSMESSTLQISDSSEESIMGDDDKEKLLSWKERFNSARDVILNLQTYLDMFASYLERVLTLFSWQVPWLTTLLLIILIIGVVLLYYMPLRYLILAYFINKYTKIIIRPGSLNNIEVFDFLSRCHTIVEVEHYKELKVLSV